nr:immunoglobulin light chain junction region [Macaca mulatta]MOW02618.1 immunoglobulin light chain junction region [Macaca mulatta]MOW02777.1 immunoglobulin light chain junction region [Macaca mulatta]MOW66961.1 immunoglobulin light chain junction region [Macaca mulatta]MOW70343.1 immunoglobulin light chain junction region [Macaca mulatta]
DYYCGSYRSGSTFVF